MDGEYTSVGTLFTPDGSHLGNFVKAKTFPATEQYSNTLTLTASNIYIDTHFKLLTVWYL